MSKLHHCLYAFTVVQRVQAVDGEGEENFQSIRIEEKDKQKLKGICADAFVRVFKVGVT